MALQDAATDERKTWRKKVTSPRKGVENLEFV